MKKVTYEYYCDSCKKQMNDYYILKVIKSNVGNITKELCLHCFEKINIHLNITKEDVGETKNDVV